MDLAGIASPITKETTMTTTSTTLPSDDARDLLQGIKDLSTACARYGLTLARASVETLARGLDEVAERIGRVAERLQKPPAAAEPPPAAPIEAAEAATAAE